MTPIAFGLSALTVSPVFRLVSRHFAISPIIRVATSCMIPRPICATRPETRMSLDIFTRLPAPSGSTCMVISACAVP